MASWQETLNREVERLFTEAPHLPAHLQAEVHLLLEWNRQTRLLVDKILRIQVQVRRWRYAREDAEASTAAIAERQRLEVEREMLERRLQEWVRQLAYLKAQIDRVTDKIVGEMRQESAQLEARHPAQDERRKAQEDLLFWEVFKSRLDAPAPLVDFDIAALVAEVQAEESERARLHEEYKRLAARPMPTSDDNAAAWADFTQEFEPKDKKRGGYEKRE